MNMKRLFKQKVKENREWLEVPEWCNPAILKYIGDMGFSIPLLYLNDGVTGTRSYSSNRIESLLVDGIQQKSAVKTLSLVAVAAFHNPEDDAYSQFKFKLCRLPPNDYEYKINYIYSAFDMRYQPFSISGTLILEDTFYKFLLEKKTEWVTKYYTCTELYTDIIAWLDKQIPTPRFIQLKEIWDEMQKDKEEITPFVAADAIRQGKI